MPAVLVARTQLAHTHQMEGGAFPGWAAAVGTAADFLDDGADRSTAEAALVCQHYSFCDQLCVRKVLLKNKQSHTINTITTTIDSRDFLNNLNPTNISKISI